MSVCLVVIADASADKVLRAFESAKSCVESYCLFVPPGHPLMALKTPSLYGRIIEEPWVGRVTNRNRAIAIAESDARVSWLIVLDGHEWLENGGTLPRALVLGEILPGADAYEIPVETRSPGRRVRHQSAGHIFRARRGFRFTGALGTELHESLFIPFGARVARHDGLVCRREDDVASSNKNVGLLGMKLGRNPEPRGAFWFARALADATRYREAYVAFLTCAQMKGDEERRFWSLIWAARLGLKSEVGITVEHAILHLRAAAEIFPDRAEPLAAQAALYRWARQHDLAAELDLVAASKPYPSDARSFVDLAAYSPRALEESGIPTHPSP